MKCDETWLSDSHVCFTLMFVPSTFSQALGPQWITGTAFSIAPREKSGGTSKFSSWTQDSGQCSQKILNDSWSASGLGLICWRMILSWCLFLSRKFLHFFSEHVSVTSGHQEPLEARNHWEACTVDAREDVRNYLTIIPLRLNKNVSIFHLLDSLSTSFPGKREGSQLQRILLKYFDHATFSENRIAVNIPQVSPSVFCHLWINSPHYSGPPADKPKWLWLFHDIFRQEVSSQPRGDPHSY